MIRRMWCWFCRKYNTHYRLNKKEPWRCCECGHTANS